MSRWTVSGPGRAILLVAAFSEFTVAATAQSPRALTVTRDLRIDAAAHDLSAGLQLDVGRDGSIAVTQPEDNKILFFDATGRLVGSVGRPGEGPGEFRAVGLHGRYADSLWVLDFQLRRTTLISPEHRFVRMISWPPLIRLTPTDSVGLPTFSGVFPQAIVRGGGFVTVLVLPRTTFTRPNWLAPAETRQPIVVTDPTGVLQKLIGWSPRQYDAECQVAFRTANGEGDVIIPYCAFQWTSFSRDGSRIAMVQQQNTTSSAGDYHLIVISAAGDTIISRKYSYAPIAIPKHVADSAIAALLILRIPGRSLSPQYVAAARSAKVPVNYAPIRRIAVGLDGTIWLEMQMGTPVHHWLVLSTTGDVVGQLTMPASVTLLAESRSAVWGVDRDSDDLESVVRYKVGQ